MSSSHYLLSVTLQESNQPQKLGGTRCQREIAEATSLIKVEKAVIREIKAEVKEAVTRVVVRAVTADPLVLSLVLF
jgi:hypothetical protein